MSILVVDVGTSSVRAAVVQPDGTVGPVSRRATPPTVPFPGLVEFDADALAAAALETAREALAHGRAGRGRRHRHAAGLDHRLGRRHRAGPRPGDRLAGPAHRRHLPGTAGRGHPDVSERVRHQVRLAPRPATTRTAPPVPGSAPWTAGSPGTSRAARCTSPIPGTPAPPGSSAGRTWPGVATSSTVSPYRPGPCPASSASSGEIGPAAALPGAPVICGLAGDQQASLIGQSCSRPGLAKVTFGTGAMLDVCVGPRPAFEIRGEAGCFPIVAWSRDGVTTWGVEAIMLAAGTTIDWLVEDLGILASAVGVGGRGRRLRGFRGGGDGPRPLRARHAAVGLRGARRPARPDPWQRPGPDSSGPCSRASPNAARTSSRPQRRTPASPSPDCGWTVG